MIVDEGTLLKFSSIYATKNGIMYPTRVLINKLSAKDIITKFIRCDNDGEKKVFRIVLMATTGN